MQSPRREIIEELDGRHVPYVCVNDRLGKPAACVLADDVSGMKSILTHLTDLDHETIAYASAPGSYFPHHSKEDRHNTLVEFSAKLNVQLVAGHDEPFNPHTPAEFVRSAVMEAGATAIIAYDHHVAFMVMGAAHAMGMRIPQDFSLICFNDVFPMSTICPAVTTIAVPGREMGRKAAEILLEELASPKSSSPREIRLPEHLIVRGSTAGLGATKAHH
jgi:DNA-binding LacI/PurR family transcriptional regulator